MNRTIWRSGMLIAILCLAAACDQLPGAAADLAVGNCFMEPSATDDISEVQHRPCGEAHDAEVFAVLNYEGDTYPIEMTLERFIDEHCLPAFASYTGEAFDTQTELTVGWFYPTRESWNEGDREVTCYLIRPDGQPLTASQRVS